jgi:hypothetical protein
MLHHRRESAELILHESNHGKAISTSDRMRNCLQVMCDTMSVNLFQRRTWAIDCDATDTDSSFIDCLRIDDTEGQFRDVPLREGVSLRPERSREGDNRFLPMSLNFQTGRSQLWPIVHLV